MATASATAPDARLLAPARTRLREWVAAALFAGYVLFALATLVLGVVAAVAGSSPALHERLHEVGLSLTTTGRVAEAMADAAHARQPAGQLAIDYAFSLANLAVAGLVLWLRPRDKTARLLAVATVGTAAVFNLQAYSVFEALQKTLPDRILHETFHLVAATAYLAALLLFPDGRLIPRWSRRAKVALYVPLAAVALLVGARMPGMVRTLALIFVFGVVTPAVGVAAQAYRYRRAPTALERQQSRLLFWALAPALVGSIVAVIGGVSASAVTVYEGRSIEVIPVAFFRAFQVLFAIIPVALFAGIVRFRLWNIERLVSRALAYGALAGLVSAVYIGVVVGLGRAVGVGNGNVALSIVATGVVAAGFAPARERLQFLANRMVYGRRATPYQVLSSFSERIGDGGAAEEETLSLMARLLAEGTAASRVVVWLVVAGEVRPAASWPADAPPLEPCRLVDGELPPLGRPTAQEPVRHGGELLGALTVRKPGTETLEPTEEKLLADLAAQAGLVLRNSRLNAELLDRLEELRASRQRLLTAQDEERRRLERNLHDGAQQQLVALKVKLGLAQRLAQTGKPVDELLGQLGLETGDAIDNLRDLARGIYPPLLADQGLEAALTAQAMKASLPVEVDAAGLGRYHQDTEAAVYFCCLEALQNIAKYAGASIARVKVREDGSTLLFSVTDDGVGFDADCTARGAGLQNMADRLDALDGTLRVASQPGHGTTLTGCVPARPAVPA